MSIPFTTSVARQYYTDRAPTVNDDNTQGHEVGNWWKDTSTSILYECKDVSTGGAIWIVKPDWSQGTFIPSLEFGGSDTGITYNSRSGNYTRVGDLVTLNLFMDLSSKGSASGSATITGLPLANGSSHAAFTIYAQNVSLSLTYTQHGARVAPSQQFIRLFETGSLLNIQNLDDGNFQNDSQIFLSGNYFLL